MSDEVIDQSGEEVEAVEDQEIEVEDTDIQTEDSPEDQSETEKPDDDEEVEYEGNKYKVPKELKDALLRQADYTRKTQEVAETRKELEQKALEIQQRAEVQQRHIQDYAQLHALDAQLEQFKRIDWQTLIDQDPVEAMKLDRQLRTLTDVRNDTVSRIREVEQQQAFEQQRTYAKALETGQEVLKREIPNWSPDKAREIKEFAINDLKIDRKVIDNLLDPQAVIALHYAKIGYQTLKQASAKPKAVEAKPVQKVSTKRDSATINPDKLSADEWVKWREKQLRKSR